MEKKSEGMIPFFFPIAQKDKWVGGGYVCVRAKIEYFPKLKLCTLNQ